MVQRIAIIALCLLCVTAHGGLTNQMREGFVGIGMLDSGSPGNLGTVTGHFYKRAIGPATNNATGWSANIRPADASTWHKTYIPDIASTNGMVCAWYYINSLSIAANASSRHLFLYDQNASSNNISASLHLTAAKTYDLTCYNSGGTKSQTNMWAPPLKQWFWIGLGYHNSGSTDLFAAWAYTNGVLFQLGTNLNGNNFSQKFIYFGGGSLAVASTGQTLGRYGLPSIYQTTGIADIAYPAEIIAPTNGLPTEWYVSPATGNDTNTGLVGFPWLTATNFNQESLYGGIFHSDSLSVGGGDVVIIDNTTPLDIGTNQLFLGASGMRTYFTNGAITAHATIQATNWTKTAALTNTWQTTDGGASDLVGIVLWEDDKWLTHTAATNFNQIKNSFDTNTGSFWCDSTNIYVNPLTGVAPTNGTEVYTRSRFRGTSGLSAVAPAASNIWVDGLRVTKTCLARTNDNDPYNGYGIQWDTGCGGTNMLSNFYVDYYSKHGAGRTTSGINLMSVIRSNCVYGCGTPYAGFGGQTSDVDYSAAGTNNSYLYIYCTNLVNVGTVGSTGGHVSSAIPFWTSHGSGRSFDGGVFDHIYTIGSFVEQTITSKTIYITNSVFDSGTFGCDFDVQRCATLTGPISQQVVGYTGNIKSSILAVNLPISNHYWALLGGTQIVSGCTIDMSKWADTVDRRSVWGRTTNACLIFTNNILLVNPASDFSLLYNFTTNDIFQMGNNVYQTGTTNFIAKDYNDGTTTTNRTFSQWVVLGFDANSVNQNACLGANLKPYAKTPCWTAGTEIGPMADYTGKLFQSRRTAGAYEYDPPPLIFLP